MKTLVIASLTALALSAGAISFAQTPPASTDKPAATAADKPAKPAADKPAADKPAMPKMAAKEHMLTGKVTAFDASAHTLSMGDKVFALDAKITDTFKVGDKVMVHYTKSGDKRSASMVMAAK